MEFDFLNCNNNNNNNHHHHQYQYQHHNNNNNNNNNNNQNLNFNYNHQNINYIPTHPNQDLIINNENIYYNINQQINDTTNIHSEYYQFYNRNDSTTTTTTTDLNQNNNYISPLNNSSSSSNNDSSQLYYYYVDDFEDTIESFTSINNNNNSMDSDNSNNKIDSQIDCFYSQDNINNSYGSYHIKVEDNNSSSGNNNNNNNTGINMNQSSGGFCSNSSSNDNSRFESISNFYYDDDSDSDSLNNNGLKYNGNESGEFLDLQVEVEKTDEGDEEYDEEDDDQVFDKIQVIPSNGNNNNNNNNNGLFNFNIGGRFQKHLLVCDETKQVYISNEFESSIKEASEKVYNISLQVSKFTNRYIKIIQGTQNKRNKIDSDILRKWLEEHIEHPYPTKQEKIVLANQIGCSIERLNTWFTNNRRRSNPKCILHHDNVEIIKKNGLEQLKKSRRSKDSTSLKNITLTTSTTATATSTTTDADSDTTLTSKLVVPKVKKSTTSSKHPRSRLRKEATSVNLGLVNNSCISQ